MEETRSRAERTRLIGELIEQNPILLEEIAALIEQRKERELARMQWSLVHEHKPVDQRRIDRMAGFYEGAEWVARSLPRQALRYLERVRAADEAPREDEA